MIPLFAAPDATGALRFISEVERGADCGCRCPVCGSPLVARKGLAYEWHFAHEAAQERPECEAAAARVWLRLMAEYLQARDAADSFSLPPYRQRVAIVRSLVNVHEDVQWNTRAMGAWQWQPLAADTGPVAQVRLDTGTYLELFVAQSGATQAVPDPADGARLVFVCSVPPAAVLRERSAVWLHLALHGEFVWRHHPDTLGLVAAARRRLEARSATVYRNWLLVADAASQAPALPAMADTDIPSAAPAPLFYTPGAPVVPEAAPSYACAPGHAPNTSFTFYRLSDAQAWLLYRLDRQNPGAQPPPAPHVPERSYALAPHPHPFDGWAHALPESVGVADLSAGVVRCRSFLDAVTYLSRRTLFTRSGRDPAAFAGL